MLATKPPEFKVNVPLMVEELGEAPKSIPPVVVTFQKLTAPETVTVLEDGHETVPPKLPEAKSPAVCTMVPLTGMLTVFVDVTENNPDVRRSELLGLVNVSEGPLNKVTVLLPTGPELLMINLAMVAGNPLPVL